VLAAATERHESRGAHTRTDFEAADEQYRLRLVLTAPA
jgi:succinate dehydrogenase/fumarate reductase flavoprotein subunit